MNLYLLTQKDNINYDMFDGMVVAAESEESARKLHPLSEENKKFWEDRGEYWKSGVWANSSENVLVKYLGKADPSLEEEIILTSYVADY
jgi:hypothetical protein